MTRFALASLLALPTVAALGCTGKYKRPVTAEKVSSTPEIVARGSYLVNQVSMCGVCHTPRIDGSWLGGERTDAFLAGGTKFHDETNGIILSVSNITPDVETGIGGWSDDEIRRAIRDGVHKDGRLLYPPMPFPSYQFMSDDDINAVVAFLRTVPPVKSRVERDYGKMGGGIKFAVKMGLAHHKPAMNVKAPPREDKLAYGKYLVLGASMCSDCHSLTDKGPNNEDNLLAGSTVPMDENGIGKVWARNLTPDPETGLGKYTAEQIKDALKHGKRLDGKPMVIPMTLIVPHLSGWTDEDLDAAVAFMKSVPPKKQKVPDYQLSPEAKKAMGL